MSLEQWIATNWTRLVQGGKLDAPTWLPHPRVAGLYPIDVATPEGQCSNWGLSYADGSRVHVHEFPDGRLVVHRDRHDPAAGLAHAVAHLLTETFVGPALLGIGLLVMASRAARA